MKQETIEQAAKKAIRNGWLCDKGEYPCEDKDKCKFCNGTSKCFGDCGGDAIPYFDGFLDGARWRISEAWHDAQDGCPPAGDEPYIAVLDIPGFGRKAEIWSGQSNHPFLVKWAYIDDLLPDGEEAER